LRIGAPSSERAEVEQLTLRTPRSPSRGAVRERGPPNILLSGQITCLNRARDRHVTGQTGRDCDIRFHLQEAARRALDRLVNRPTVAASRLSTQMSTRSRRAVPAGVDSTGSARPSEGSRRLRQSRPVQPRPRYESSRRSRYEAGSRSPGAADPVSPQVNISVLPGAGRPLEYLTGGSRAAGHPDDRVADCPFAAARERVPGLAGLPRRQADLVAAPRIPQVGPGSPPGRPGMTGRPSWLS